MAIYKPQTNNANSANEQHPPAAAMDVDLSGLTDDDLRQECRESLVLMMRKARGDLKALGAVRELLDRIEGKPLQRQATLIGVTGGASFSGILAEIEGTSAGLPVLIE